MNRLILIAAQLCCVSHLMAQKIDYAPFPHYTERVEEFARMAPIDSTSVVMLGNSLTENAGDWNVLLAAKRVKNRGVAGDDAIGIEHRLVQILPGKPKAIFLMVGINDMSHGLTARQVFDQAARVIATIRRESPATKLFVQSVLPINENFGRWAKLEGRTDDVPVLNTLLRRYCEQENIPFIDLFKQFVRRGTNQMRSYLTIDGLHLTPAGYKVWAFELKRYIKSL